MPGMQIKALSNDPSLEGVLRGRRISAREAPKPAKCSRCESWQQRCRELESALQAAQQQLAQAAAQKPCPVVSKATQTEIGRESLAVQTELAEVAPMETAGCQTLKFPCGHCHGAGVRPTVADAAAQAMPPGTRDVGLQAFAFVWSNCVATQASVLQSTMATQTSNKLSIQRDVGCYVAMVDEEHTRQRQALLAKIDNLLDESERMRSELTSSQHANSKMRLEMERLLCNSEVPEPVVGCLSGCPRPPRSRATSGKKRGAEECAMQTAPASPFMSHTEVSVVSEPSVHDSWIEFARGPLDVEELGVRVGRRLSGPRKTPRGAEPPPSSTCSPSLTDEGLDGVLSAGSLEIDSFIGSPQQVECTRSDWRPRCSAVGTTLSLSNTPAVQRLVSTGADVVGASTRPRAASLRGVEARRPSGNSGPDSSRGHQEPAMRRYPLIAHRSI